MSTINMMKDETACSSYQCSYNRLSSEDSNVVTQLNYNHVH